MKKTLILIALFYAGLSGLRAQNISYVDTTRSWYYVYDEKGKKIATLSTNIGELQGYSSSILVVRSGAWYYIYDAKGKKIATLSANYVGKVLSVAGDTFTSRSGSWIYTWSKTGKKIGTRSAAH